MTHRPPCTDGGGDRVPSTSTTLPMHFRPVYQRDADLVARRVELKALFGEAARSLRPYARTAQERRVVDDAARGHRLSFAGLETLVRLSARAEQWNCLELAIRNAVLSEMAHPTVVCAKEANERETAANGPLNHAQLLAEREDSAVRWVQVSELAAVQANASQVLRDAAWQRALTVVS